LLADDESYYYLVGLAHNLCQSVLPGYMIQLSFPSLHHYYQNTSNSSFHTNFRYFDFKISVKNNEINRNYHLIKKNLNLLELLL